MIPVIFGILIALFINSWNQQRQDNNYMEEIFQSIDSELAEGKKEIVENLPKQNQLIDSLMAYLSDEQMPVIEIALKADGFHAPKVRTNSWEALSRTKIELVAYDVLRALSEIEEGKELLREKERYLMNYVFLNIKGTSKEVKETIVLLLRDIISTEISLKQDIEYYESLGDQ